MRTFCRRKTRDTGKKLAMKDRNDKTYYLDPVKYADGVYYIGTDHYPSWLIDCGDEVALLDTAMPEDKEFLLENIEKLGYSINDIGHILHSHGHIDHIGATKDFAAMSGAKTYIGKGDEDTVAGRNELQWTNEFNMEFTCAFEPDVIISDGDKIKIGNREFYFINTPGHTAGTLSIFFDVTDEGRTYRAGMFGGAGCNSMLTKYLNKYSLPLSLRDDFKKSIKRLYAERVEVHLGNHIGNANHHEKVAMLGQGKNPFIEEESWKALLDKKLIEIEKIIAEEG